MQIDEHSPLDRALSKVHPRRVVLAALALGGAAAAIAPAADLAAKKKKKKEMAWSYRAQFGSLGSEAANFRYPKGVTVSANGRTAWVADYYNQRISVWTRPTSTSTEWSHSINFGSGGTAEAEFLSPNCVAVSADGATVWVADLDNNRISVWTRPTSTSTEWSHSINFGSGGTGNANFNSPNCVAVSADGRTVWVADRDNHRISVWTRSTEDSTDWSPSTTFGSEGSDDANFRNPQSVAAAADGRTVWVADRLNQRISVWTRPSNTSTNWSHSTNFGTGPAPDDAKFDSPWGVAVSANGRTVWVVDFHNQRISVWTRPPGSLTAWSHSTNFGSNGTGDDNFTAPNGVAVSANGRTVWVADTDNNRISIWTYS